MKNDIFDQLNKIDSLDINAIDEEEFYKKFSPFMILKWSSYTKDANRVLLVNELLNPMIFTLHKEKKLLYYLACCCSDGTKKRYSWLKRPKKPNVKVLKMIAEYYDIGTGEAKHVLGQLSKNDLLEILECMGYDDKLVKEIKKAI